MVFLESGAIRTVLDTGCGVSKWDCSFIKILNVYVSAFVYSSSEFILFAMCIEQRIKRRSDSDYPTGEFEFKKPGTWKTFVVNLCLLTAFPWQRVRKGSVLNIKLHDKICDQVKSRFSSALSLPQIFENLIKAAYDPRISGIYLHIETLKCGWAKIEEIRRHILDFRKSGRFVIV
ncbi:hypothetical protein LXL04_038569 [Taraxacum kok-saghyz]